MFPRSPTPECFARKFESHCTMLGNLYLQATSALTVHNAPAAGWPARRDFVAPLASGNWISPHTDKASFAPGMSKTNSSCLGSLADPGLQYPLPASLCPAEEWSARSSNRPPSTEVDRLCQARYTWYSRVVDFYLKCVVVSAGGLSEVQHYLSDCEQQQQHYMPVAATIMPSCKSCQFQELITGRENTFCHELLLPAKCKVVSTRLESSRVMHIVWLSIQDWLV